MSAQIPHGVQFYDAFGGQTKFGPAQGGRILSNFGVYKLLGWHLEADVEDGIDFTRVAGARATLSESERASGYRDVRVRMPDRIAPAPSRTLDFSHA